jgi:glycosyltransferase involved in cell wall biosynthesis
VTPGIHQVLAGAAERDAITNHALAAQQVIRDMGFASEVFVEDAHISPEVGTQVHEHTTWDALAQPGDLAIVHYSIDSPAFDYALDRAAKSAVHYHNVTPAELLWRDLPALAAQCRDGRTRLADLTGRVVRSASDSQFNAQEMLALGLPPADVVGILRQRLPISPRTPDATNARPRLLFVGRGVPNKCQHELIMAVAALSDAGVDAELRLVGSWGGSRTYFERCMRTARMLGVADSVVVLDSLNDEDLAQEYADADVFLCLSDHEGYCVPLLEAMAADLPIVAFAAGAVPETLGRAGLLLTDKSPSMVAEAVAAVLGGALASEMGAGRGAQLAHHSREATTQRLRAFIGEFSEC